MISLLDAAHRHVVYWYIVFSDRENEYWWNRWLMRGFQHVQAWREIRYGKRPDDVMWLHVDPFAAATLVDVVFEPEPPWRWDKTLTVVHVSSACDAQKVRELFAFGPISCVETMKSLLGVKSFWIRTPRQLYNHICKHNGVLIS